MHRLGGVIAIALCDQSLPIVVHCLHGSTRPRSLDSNQVGIETVSDMYQIDAGYNNENIYNQCIINSAYCNIRIYAKTAKRYSNQ